jgi:hypothetical protein
VCSNVRNAQVIEGTEVVFTRVAAPKAVLLLFHGCSHSAKDWGANSTSCPGCMGAKTPMLQPVSCNLEWHCCSKECSIQTQQAWQSAVGMPGAISFVEAGLHGSSCWRLD